MMVTPEQIISTQSLMSAGGGSGRNIIAVAGSGIFLLTSAAKAFTIVPEGERGVQTRWGRATKKNDSETPELLFDIVKPGFHFVIPFTHSIKRISIQDRNTELDAFSVDDDKSRQFDVRAAIAWGVRADDDNPYRALYNVDSPAALTKSVSDICTGGLHTVMRGLSEARMNDKAEVYGSLKEVCASDLLYYGSELRKLQLKNIAPSFGQKLVEASMRDPVTLASLAGQAEGQVEL